MRHWHFEIRGGAWDGADMEVDEAAFPSAQETPPLHLYAYKCGPRCVGHIEFDLAQCPLHTVVVYNRDEVDYDEHTAVYTLGDMDTEDERELVGAGVDERGVFTGVEMPDTIPTWLQPS